MNFSTNQVKQLYVAKALDTNVDTLGDIAFYNTGNGEIYAKFMGEGGKVRTDLIPINNIISAKAIKSYTEAPNSAYITCDPVVAGQQYILRVKVKQFGGLGEEETCELFADYKAKSGDTAESVLYALGKLLKANQSKLYWPLVNVYMTTSATAAGVSSANAVEIGSADPSTAAYVALVLEAADQPYRKGIFEQTNVDFVVSGDKIISSGEDVDWITVVTNTAHVASAWVNSKKIADLEYFCMGERGDIYRGVGFPNNLETAYMVNPTQQYGYHLIDIQYYFEGEGENPQKSQKELVIAVPAEGLTTYDAIDAIIGASSNPATGTINNAAGKTLVARLS